MEKVIVTGATSMLGLALLKECINNNIEVIAIIRENSTKSELIPLSPYVKVVQCDLKNLSSCILPENGNYDAFYHFAWECTDNKSRNYVEAQDINIGYTLDAVKFAHKYGCKKFVGAGSQAEYGRVDGKISTDMRVAPDSAYGVAKYAAGRMSAILSQQLGIEFIWTRIFSTYGINDMPSTMIMYCIDSLLKQQKPILTRCEQVWDYLNCKDAGRAFYLIGEKGKDQAVYNIGSGSPHTLLEYVYEIRDAIDKNLEVGIGEKEYAHKQVMHLCADITNLMYDTGFAPAITFKEGIRETIEWYKEIVSK
ncbi:NAD-dependent epimerase/dehydratase family protein [Paenibacillus ferrarius]|uniref:NAD-dependent epimerase/dehydratase family protein n=1 Tax=Paenibacillus ferrarius TaxID=1469647 RepID=UPI003D2C0BF7